MFFHWLLFFKKINYYSRNPQLNLIEKKNWECPGDSSVAEHVLSVWEAGWPLPFAAALLPGAVPEHSQEQPQAVRVGSQKQNHKIQTGKYSLVMFDENVRNT